MKRCTMMVEWLMMLTLAVALSGCGEGTPPATPAARGQALAPPPTLSPAAYPAPEYAPPAQPLPPTAYPAPPLSLTPSRTPWPTIPPELPTEERGRRWLAARMGLPPSSLILAEATTYHFPLTKQSLWYGWYLNDARREPLLNDVIIDLKSGAFVDGGVYDASWRNEEAAFRTQYEHRIKRQAADRYDLQAELEIVAGFVSYYPLQDLWIWFGKVQIRDEGGSYRVAIDYAGNEVDEGALEKARKEAQQAQYGKLDRELYYLLRLAPPREPIPVLISVPGVDEVAVNEELGRRFPQVGAAFWGSGQPVDERGQPIPLEPTLAEAVRETYNQLLNEAQQARTQPLMDYLEAQGYEGEASGYLPLVVATLPAEMVRHLAEAELPFVTGLGWGALEWQSQLESVRGMLRVRPLWEAGYRGAGVRVGLLERGVVSPDESHPALAGKVVAVNVPGSPATDPHAALVAGVLVGNGEPAGLMPDNYSLYSAQTYNDWRSFEAGVNWLVDQGAFAINISLATTGTRAMQPEDRVLDYLVRLRDATIVVVAGHEIGDEFGENVRSPGKGYNVLTVGGFADQNDPFWDNDEIWSASGYRPPFVDGAAISLDRVKPEVVAVGVGVTSVYPHPADPHGYATANGTSMAAPQVTALAALLMERYPFLRTNPEAIKAMLVASATHHPAPHPTDTLFSERGGAGAIDAADAFSLFQRGGWHYLIIPDLTDHADPANPFAGPDSFADFGWGERAFAYGSPHASQGSRVRVAIAWASNPRADPEIIGGDHLSTDFDLEIRAPSGILVGSSAQIFNNVELVEFIAPASGRYTVRVRYQPMADAPPEGPFQAIGMAWYSQPPLTLALYLPLLTRYPPSAASLP